MQISRKYAREIHYEKIKYALSRIYTAENTLEKCTSKESNLDISRIYTTENTPEKYIRRKLNMQIQIQEIHQSKDTRRKPNMPVSRK